MRGQDRAWICGACTRSGEPCQNYPMGNGRCRMHGGASLPAGPTHSRWKHGRYNKAAGRVMDPIARALAKLEKAARAR